MPRASPPPLPWLDPGQAFPPVAAAWGPGDPAPGLLAAGGTLDVATLCQAYRHGIFPWFSEGQPILWWSTDPRMVLAPADFRLHRSLAKTLAKFRRTPGCEVRFDTAFGQVIRACAQRPPKQDRTEDQSAHANANAHSDGAAATGTGANATRTEQQTEEDEEAEETTSGTWIVPAMVAAYEALHRAGFAHSVETWIDGELVGGLYCVALGRAVFGESMFSRRTDASKIALACLVAFCRAEGVAMIDCQQNTGHLATLGGHEISRSRFTRHVAEVYAQPALPWRFENVYWKQIFPGSA